MDASDVQRAVVAAMSIASALGLAVDDAVVLHNSNKLAVRLLPCDAVARVAPLAQQVARFEVELGWRLAEAGSPVAALEPRAGPRVYERDGFVVTLWTYYASVTPGVAPADYAKALGRLHAGMRTLDVTTPHFMDRVAEAEADRAFLGSLLERLSRTITERGNAEQLLHGEPHPGNVISTMSGPVFIDLETCCRGPIEFDLAHMPEAVTPHYPGVDPDLLAECRCLVLAMVAAWRWDAGDQFPNGLRVGHELISTLRRGPPWPSLDVMMRSLASS